MVILPQICFHPAPCNENEVRLNEEVVQVCHNEEWGLVCVTETTWNLEDANVVCDQARLPSGGEFSERSVYP